MVLDNLGESLRATLAKIARTGTVDEATIKEVVRDIQRALLQADVNVKLALKLTREIERRAVQEKPRPGQSAREHVLMVVYEELVKLLGEAREIKPRKQTIMMVGLYGQGKTTTCGKLGKWFAKKGVKVGFIAADVHRPAAYEQLKTLATQTHAMFYGEPDAWKGQEADETDAQLAGGVAAKIVERGIKELRGRGCDVIIVDTAGRDKLETGLIDEMKQVFDAAKPDEKLLVMDAQVGQQAGPQARAFHEAVQVTGVIITKLDGTAKGGGALTAVSETQAPVLWIGVGEKIDDLEKFDSARFISRLLGMGDIQTLLEKAQESITDEDKAEETAKKIMTGRFSLVELREQMEMLSGMGPLGKVLDMIPGFSMRAKMKNEQMEATQRQFEKFKVVMSSMTQYEMENPGEIKASRIRRISRGAGVEPQEVKALLQYYETSKKTMKGLAGNKKMQRKLMAQLGVDPKTLAQHGSQGE